MFFMLFHFISFHFMSFHFFVTLWHPKVLERSHNGLNTLDTSWIADRALLVVQSSTGFQSLDARDSRKECSSSCQLFRRRNDVREHPRVPGNNPLLWGQAFHAMHGNCDVIKELYTSAETPNSSPMQPATRSATCSRQGNCNATAMQCQPQPNSKGNRTEQQCTPQLQPKLEELNAKCNATLTESRNP